METIISNNSDDDVDENTVINSNNGKSLNEKLDNAYTYEEAVTEIGLGKYQLFVLFACGVCLMSVVTEGINMGMALPSAKCDLTFTPAQQGLINSMGFLGIVTSSHFWGLMADTWGRQKVLRLTSFCSFAFSLISSFSVTVDMLMVTRFFVGFFISGLQASTLTYLSEFHCNKNRKKYVTIATMCMTASVFYMGLMAWLIIPGQWKWYIFGMVYSPWRFYILCSSLLSVSGFVAFCFLPESPKFLLAMGKKDEAVQVLQNVYRINTGNPTETFIVKSLAFEALGNNIANTHGYKDMAKLIWNQTWPLFMPPHLLKTFLLSYLLFVMYSIAHGSFLWFPDILTAMTDHIDEPNTICQAVAIRDAVINANNSGIAAGICTSNKSITYLIIMVIGILLTLIFLLFITLLNRVKLRYLLVIWMILTTLAAIALNFGRNFYLIILLLVTFFSSGNCASALSGISAELYPTNIRAMAICIILMFGRFGAVAGSNFVAALINNNCTLIFYIYAAALLTCIIICCFLPIPSSKTENPK